MDPVPPKIQAAMQFLHFAQGCTAPSQSPYGGEAQPGRELTKMEAEVYDSALVAMLEYFNVGTVSEPRPQPPGIHPPDDPREPSPVLA